MQRLSAVRLRKVSLSALLLTPLALARPQAATAPAPSLATDDVPAQIKLLQQQLAEQRRAIEALQAALRAQPAPASGGASAPAAPAAATAAASAGPPAEMQNSTSAADGVSTTNELDGMRGAGNLVPGSGMVGDAEGGAAAGAALEKSGNAAATGAAPAASPVSGAQGGSASNAVPQSASGIDPNNNNNGTDSAAAPIRRNRAAGTRQAGTDAVGKPPPRDSRPPAVAPLFEQPGVLTPRGKYVLEPSLQFGYSSSNRVALVGYTIIPALLIGLIDVREIKRNTVTAALTGRVGLSNRLEAELKVPYVYRSDATVSRELFTGTAVERVFDTSGRAVGDVEAALRYQLNDGGADKPYFVGGLRFKSRTGRDPFSVVTDCTRRCVGENVSGTGLPLELPTGSGFYSLQPSLTWLLPSDPAVFFGSVSYLHNIKRSGVSRLVLGGEREALGEIKPGDILGFNFGMGLALNDKASLSLGYDHSSIARTKQNGVAVPGAVRTQLGTLLVGFSYRLNEKRTVNVAIGAGLTRDTPDVSLTIRVPTSF